MKTILERLEQKVQVALQNAFGKELSDQKELLKPEVVPSKGDQFGHYQCNNPLKLSKSLGKNPRDIAKEIVSLLTDGMFQKIEIAGPGFINFTLSSSFLEKEIEELLHDAHFGVPYPKITQKIVVDFSQPNIAKELHVGHLRSTIIGDAIARLFEFLGHDVLRLNHIGDWGTQFGMLIAYLKENEPDVLTGKKKVGLNELMDWYRKSKVRFDEDPDFKKRAQEQVVLLQGGDEVSLEAWQMICDISRKGFEEIYRLLDVKLIERGESFYNPYLPQVVADLEKRGVAVVSQGAKCVFLDGFVTREGDPLPLIIQKSDGGYNYATTDMAALRHRIEIEKADRIIVVTDAGQKLHFEMVTKAAEKAGYLDPKKVRFDHVPFGVVLTPDGKKFKTRSGETLKLIDLIQEAIDRAKEIFKTRLPEASEEEINELATILGVDSLKYADLSCHRIKDYVFSYERMLRFEGNTAPFLLYAYVRIQGIKRKVGKDINEVIKISKVNLEHPTEIALALHVRRFGEVLEKVADDLLPNQLCEYLYELAEKFHAFFRDCRVEGSDYEDSRLILCEATGRILKKGLEILGLKTLEKM